MIKTKQSREYEIWSENLTKVYGKGTEAVHAVKGINLKIEPGVHGFLGPNGAGKTTTLNMLVGALNITDGKAKVRGKKAGSVRANSEIGFLPQDPVFYNKLTGEEYLIYMGRLNGLGPREAKLKAQRLLYDSDLWEARNREIGEYSGGMKQKIGIASVLIHDPKLLILDEPTANLDPLGRLEIINKIKEISENVSVFVSSHILSEIEQMCEKVTIINQGTLITSDSIDNIKRKFAGNTYVLNTNKNAELYEEIQSYNYIKRAWINKENGKIQIIPQEVNELRQNIPKLIMKHEAILIEFYLPELSLQDIFMEIMAKEDKKNEIK